MRVSEVTALPRWWMSAVGEVVRSVGAADLPERVLTGVAVQARELIGFCAVMLAGERRERLLVVGCSGGMAATCAFPASGGPAPVTGEDPKVIVGVVMD